MIKPYPLKPNPAGFIAAVKKRLAQQRPPQGTAPKPLFELRSVKDPMK